jgi:hypothetical protein
MSIRTRIDTSTVQPDCGSYFHVFMLLTKPASTLAEPVPFRILTLLTLPSWLTTQATLGERFSRLESAVLGTNWNGLNPGGFADMSWQGFGGALRPLSLPKTRSEHDSTKPGGRLSTTWVARLCGVTPEETAN